MKAKRIIARLLCCILCLCMLTACANSTKHVQSSNTDATEHTMNGKNLHTIYFRDATERKEVFAEFFNSGNKESEEVRMTAVDKDADGFTYSCEGDVSTYNMVRFRYDAFCTDKVCFNRCVSGWCNSKYGFLPYTYGADDPYESRSSNSAALDDTFVYDNEMYDDVTFTFNGYDKVVHIWTPDDYEPTSSEPYATVYLLDGQGMIFLGIPGEPLQDSEHADVQVQSMTAATGYKAIVAAVDTGGDPKGLYSRLDEMTPDLGELAYEEETKKLGNLLSDFIAESVVPYVQQHYNVYTDARHTSIIGKSLGGLEAFYMALEHPDLFGTAGVLSPSFMLYSDDVWRSYLSEKCFDEDSPFLYFYSGNETEDNGDVTDEMAARIKQTDYPQDRFIYHREKIGGHTTFFWRSCFSEFLNAMVFQSVESLSNHTKES